MSDPNTKKRITLSMDPRIAWATAIILVCLFMVSIFRMGMLFAARPTTAAADPRPCEFELPPGQQYLALGRACPTPDCKQGLLSCHGQKAHQAKSLIKKMLALGEHPDEIRRALDKIAPLTAPEESRVPESPSPESRAPESPAEETDGQES